MGYGRSLCSVGMKYKATKIKGAVTLYCNEDPAIQMVQDFEERVGKWDEGLCFNKRLGLRRGLVSSTRVQSRRKGLVKSLEDEVRNRRWQGSLITTRR